MKLTIDRDTLLKGLSHVQSVVERRNTIPILSNVQLAAGSDGLSLTATDLDLAVNDRIEANVAENGSITTPAHTLYDIVRKLPDGAEAEFAYSGDADRLVLSAGRSRFELACLPSDDFPTMSEGELPHRFQISSTDLKRLIDKTRFAISTEETRYYLNGIYVHAAESNGDSALRFVATDGHRLARVELALPDGAKGMPGVIVPRKTINEVRKLIDEFENDIGIALSDTKIRFDLDGAVLTSKLIDGTFPDYTRVIPTENDKTLEADGKSLAAAVERVATISTEKSRAVKFNVEEDRLTLSVTSSEHGSATEEVAVDYKADPMEIGFNSRYLVDILEHLEGETVEAKLADSSSPTLIKDSGDEDALFVLMPMRV